MHTARLSGLASPAQEYVKRPVLSSAILLICPVLQFPPLFYSTLSHLFPSYPGNILIYLSVFDDFTSFGFFGQITIAPLKSRGALWRLSISHYYYYYYYMPRRPVQNEMRLSCISNTTILTQYRIPTGLWLLELKRTCLYMTTIVRMCLGTAIFHLCGKLGTGLSWAEFNWLSVGEKMGEGISLTAALIWKLVALRCRLRGFIFFGQRIEQFFALFPKMLMVLVQVLD